MRILITNDDSISSNQLLPLIRFCKTLGEVTVAVPKYEQSAKSHSIELHKPFSVEEQTLDGDVKAYVIGSSPADCVRLMVLGFGEKYDLVISGINLGFNMGTDMLYSGTVAAVREAGILGIPAIALSTNPENNEAVNELKQVFDYIKENKLLEIHTLYNINIPPEPKGIKITRQGGPYYSDNFVPEGKELYRASGICVYKKTDDLTIDSNAVMENYISILPITINMTAKDVFEKLQ
ncbi:MAG: 5'/3'-nucleotidase SurE [Clostridia bacterium]|nr:5'/3'-nucleotidase SurE [Clostridia bacterium]